MMLLNLLPPFVSILMIVALVLTLLGPETIQFWLGNRSGCIAYVIAAVVGSVALIPGPAAYPMSGMLVDNGVAYPVIAVFITTLMMVGIVTLPLERKFFGMKLALARNALNFVGALGIGMTMALVWNLL
ncbi:MAG: hypothetical protein JXQ84_07140 [Rhodospirillaceae bacterium]|nr:hypothetical protein [Rhodospirillaceae bacterium]